MEPSVLTNSAAQCGFSILLRTYAIFCKAEYDLIVGVVVVLCIIGVASGLLFWSVRKYGWPGTWRLIQAWPARIWYARNATRTNSRRRRGTTSSIEETRFIKFTEPAHKVTLKYPATWTLSRSSDPASSMIVQLTCDSSEESYKRVSIAWDDVSWSSMTAEKYARGLIDNVLSVVPNSQLVSHGLYRSSVLRTDGAYEIVYTAPDPVDSSTMQFVNVIVVSSQCGQRKAFTISFGAEAQSFHAASQMARYIVDSFVIDNVSNSQRPSDADDVHINVWEREKTRLLGEEASFSGPKSVNAASVVSETPADVNSIIWANGAITQSSLGYAYPAAWLCSGLGHDESLGFSPVAVHSARRWCIAHVCDRRESSFKHVSIICIDITPCYDIITARVAKNPKCLEGQEPGAVLLAYLAYRYKAELAEAAAKAAARAPILPPFPAGEDFLKAWVDNFGQRWPVTCKLSTPVSAANVAQVVAPNQTEIIDQRVVGNSRLLKVRGWLRTINRQDGSSAGSVHRSSDGGRRSSTYSSLSMEHDVIPAEGLHIDTTSAVLIGIHDALVASGTQKTAAAKGKGTAPMQKRIFGHIVTCGTDSTVFQSYEPMVKHVFRSLNTVLER